MGLATTLPFSTAVCPHGVARVGQDTEVRTRAPGKFTPRVNAKLVVNASWSTRTETGRAVMIPGARASKFYTGEEWAGCRADGIFPERGTFLSHVVEDSNKFKSRRDFAPTLHTAGVKKGDRCNDLLPHRPTSQPAVFSSRATSATRPTLRRFIEDWSTDRANG